MAYDLTAKQEAVAVLLFDDSLTDEEIAARVGISWRTLMRWKADPAIQARISSLRTKLMARDDATSVRVKDNRIQLMEDVVRDLLTIKEEQARNQFVKDEPGGKTGLIRMEVGPGGRGWQYALDERWLKQLAAYLKQISQEKGEWTEKREFAGTVHIDVEAFFSEMEKRWSEPSSLESSKMALLPTLPEKSSA